VIEMMIKSSTITTTTKVVMEYMNEEEMDKNEYTWSSRGYEVAKTSKYVGSQVHERVFIKEEIVD
jgi:hypothetical protein